MNNKTIIEKIINSKECLGVDRIDILGQIMFLYNSKDKEGMKQLFEAYKNWEIKGLTNESDIAEGVQIARENFDYISNLADAFYKYNDLETAAMVLSKLPKIVPGEINKFYKDAIDYHPIEPDMN